MELPASAVDTNVCVSTVCIHMSVICTCLTGCRLVMISSLAAWVSVNKCRLVWVYVSRCLFLTSGFSAVCGKIFKINSNIPSLHRDSTNCLTTKVHQTSWVASCRLVSAIVVVCYDQPPSSYDIYRLHRLVLSSNSWTLTYVNAVLVRLTSSSPDIYHRRRLL